MADDAIVVRGNLGWSNGHKTASSYDVYGPDGRWGRRPRNGDPIETQGHLLADALNEAGAHEGARFVVVAINRFGDDGLLDEVEAFVADRTALVRRVEAAEAYLATKNEPYCAACDHGGHTCPGCGGDVDHGTIACDDCDARG